MDSSTPGFTVLHYPPEVAQAPVHWVGVAILYTYIGIQNVYIYVIFPAYSIPSKKRIKIFQFYKVIKIYLHTSFLRKLREGICQQN